MKHIRKSSLRVSLALAIVAVLGAYAFTAENTFDSALPRAGDGEAAISGFEVSNVTYTVADVSSVPSITKVSFDLDGDPTVVRAAINQGSLVTCVEPTVGDSDFECVVTSSLEDATHLRVVAHE